MKQLKQMVTGIMAVFGLVTLLSVPAFAAYNPIKDSGACRGSNAPEVCKDLGVANGKQAVNKTVQNVINILFYVIGIVSVIMIIVGGLKYTTSNGDSSAVTSAKNTILYAVIGLVIALLAYSIVNFVLDWF